MADQRHAVERHYTRGRVLAEIDQAPEREGLNPASPTPAGDVGPDWSAVRSRVMSKLSAGLLMFRRRGGAVELLLAHPGGPYWRKKDEGAWTIPKGLIEPGESGLDTARREFHEETGFAATAPFIPLGEIRQKGGKTVEAWACEGDADPAALKSNTFEMEWPPRSGRMQSFPEIDRVAFYGINAARKKINSGQVELIDRLSNLLDQRGHGVSTIDSVGSES